MLEHLFGVPFTLLSFIVVLSVVVFVHELGHFLVARRCGVRCDAFSIGFGPELFGYTDKKGTRWKFSLIPLGGYVKMFGEGETMQAVEGGGEPVRREMTDAEKSVSLKYKPVGQRAAIVFAGPAVNFLFAVAVFFVLYLAYGRQIVEPVVGMVVENSAAAEAHLQPGDRIVSIDGKQIKEFVDISRLVQLGYGTPMAVVLTRDGERMELTVTPRIEEVKDDFGNLQKMPVLGFEPMVEPVIGEVRPGGAAAEAGLKVGDRVMAIDGQKIATFDDIRRLIQRGQGAPMAMSVRRGDDQGLTELTMAPRIVEEKDAAGNVQKKPMLGIAPQIDGHAIVRLGPAAALSRAVGETYGVVEATGIALGQMVSGRRGTEGLGGPISIAKYSGQAARVGFVSFVILMATISINLGLINLFPVPLLDGGHLLFYAIEAVRGRPLSDQAQEWGMRIGLALVGSLMLFAFGNDLVHVVWPSIRL